MTAWALAAGFALVSLPFLSRCYNQSAFTYVVVAEEGLYKPHEAAHPLYVPLLRAVARLAKSLGRTRPCLELFQYLSLAGGCALVFALYRLAFVFSKDAWASAWAALFFAFQQGPWMFSMQTKPYSWAAFLAAAAISEVAGSDGNPFLAGLAAALSMGFHAINAGLVAWAILARRWSARFWAAPALFGLLGCFAAYKTATFASLFASPHLRRDSLLFEPNVFRVALTYFQTLLRFSPSALAALFLIPLLEPRIRLAGSSERKAASFALGIFAAFSASFLVLDAANDYVYAALLGLPPLLACVASRRPVLRAALPALTLAAASLSFAEAIWPLSKPELDPARVEGGFLAESLGRGDLLAVAGAPDWRLAYLFRDRFGIMRFDTGKAGAGLYDPPSMGIAPAAFDAVALISKEGGKSWLAADTFFRPGGVLSKKDIDAYQGKIAGRLSERFTLGPPRISPQGQYYYPILPKKSLRAGKP